MKTIKIILLSLLISVSLLNCTPDDTIEKNIVIDISGIYEGNITNSTIYSVRTHLNKIVEHNRIVEVLKSTKGYYLRCEQDYFFIDSSLKIEFWYPDSGVGDEFSKRKQIYKVSILDGNMLWFSNSIWYYPDGTVGLTKTEEGNLIKTN